MRQVRLSLRLSQVRMPRTGVTRPHVTGSTWLLTLLCACFSRPGYQREGHTEFMGRYKAVFSGCGDFWTLRESMPGLQDVSVCVDVYLQSAGQWTAFTYGGPRYELALLGDGQGLDVWLAGVQYSIRMHMTLHRWHRVCLRRAGPRLHIQAGSDAVERRVPSRPLAARAELLLGCRQSAGAASAEQEARVELYMLRVWNGTGEYGDCEDSTLLGWDTLLWDMSEGTREEDDTLTCGQKRSKREAAPPVPHHPTLLPGPASNSSSGPEVTAWPLSSDITAPGLPQGAAGSTAVVITGSPPSTAEPVVVQCNFSQYCTSSTAYYWMSITVEKTGGNLNQTEISQWLSAIFSNEACVSATQFHSTAVPLSVSDTPQVTTTESSAPDSSTEEQNCSATTNTSAMQVKGIEVTCAVQTDVRMTNCTVVVQTAQPVESCVLRQALQGGNSEYMTARVLGEVQTVGKALCAGEDLLMSSHRSLICSSSTPLCTSEELQNISCWSVDATELPVDLQTADSQACGGQSKQNCSCSSFCGEGAYYALTLNVSNPNTTITDIQTVFNQLSPGVPCNNALLRWCSLYYNVSQGYEGTHLECHGTQMRLHSCMAVVKLVQMLDVCVLSAVLTPLLQNHPDIEYDGLVTQAVICSSLSEPGTNLLESNFTWVSTDFSLDQICGNPEPLVLTCNKSETFCMLLNDSCSDPLPSVATPTITPTYSLHNNSTVSYSPNTTAASTAYVTLNTLQTHTTNTTETTTELPLNTTHTHTTSHTGAVLQNSTYTPASTTTQPDTIHTANTLTSQLTAAVTPNITGFSILNQTLDMSTLNSTQVVQLVSSLEKLLSGPNISLELGRMTVGVISNLLQAPADVLVASSSRIISIVETVALKLVLQTSTEIIAAKSLAVAVTKADGANFKQTSFFISDLSNLQVSVNSLSRSSSNSSFLGSITLPSSLTSGLSVEEQQLSSRLQFSFYPNTTVFQDSSLGTKRVNSGILGTSVANVSIHDLKENVVVTLRNTQSPMGGNVSCVFWDLNRNDGSAGWNQSGCVVVNMTGDVTVCSCEHLTSFAVLLDISRQGVTDPVQEMILTFITYIGCGISAIFLSFTLLTYLCFEKLRRDIPSKILIQLCLALLLLNMVFLLDAWLALYTDAPGLCISTAFFLHYFLLASFTWMGLEAFHMYLALVKVFNTNMSHYMLKFGLVGWGVPLVVVIVVISISKNNYGLVSYGKHLDGSTDDFCWLKSDVAFYVAVVAYFCLIFLLNMTMFVVVLVQLHRIKQQNPQNIQHRSVLQDMRSIVGLTFLLGLTWAFAFFAWGPVNLAFMYLFAIFNSLQGLFIFIFHCAVKENVQRQWRVSLCCGSLRLLENSEWSRTHNTARERCAHTGPSFHSSHTASSSIPASDNGSVHQLDSSGSDSALGSSGGSSLLGSNRSLSRQRLQH